MFVHVDMHTFFQSLVNLKPLMSDSTLIFVSVANIVSDLGFDRFKKQKSFKVSGFCFMSPEIAIKITTEAGFEIVSSNLKGHVSCKDLEPNLYYERDILMILRKK